MSETPPEPPTLEQLAETFRKATLEGMKDYDRERAEWEAAEAENKAKEEKPTDDGKPKTGGGIGGWLLGGKSA